MSLDPEQVKSRIQTALGPVKLKPLKDSLLLEEPGDLLKVAGFLRESPDYRLDYLSSITAVDYLKYLESVYHFYSVEKKLGPLVLRVRVTKSKPAIPSLTALYLSAELQERENYDLFGIVYENHPDLKRLFLWENFDGHPLRKDYLQEDSETLEMADVEWLEKHGVAVPPEAKAAARRLYEDGKRALAPKVREGNA
jgi:NADH:ubiquinone oxidoreductase subunit C